MKVIKQYFGSGRCILLRKYYSGPYLNMTAIGVIYFESEIYRLNETKLEQCKIPNCISSEQSRGKKTYIQYMVVLLVVVVLVVVEVRVVVMVVVVDVVVVAVIVIVIVVVVVVVVVVVAEVVAAVQSPLITVLPQSSTSRFNR
jgi:hypothetical protein